MSLLKYMRGSMSKVEKKKILFIIWALESGGAERALINLLNELPEEKYEIDLMLIAGKGFYFNQLPDYVCVIEPPEDLKKLYGSTLKAGRLMPAKLIGTAFSKLMHKHYKLYRWKHFYSKHIACCPEHYDVAVAFMSGELSAIVAEKINANKKIIFVHNDYIASDMEWEYEQEYFDQVDNIITISQTCVDSIIKTFPTLTTSVSYLPNINSSAVIKCRAEEFVPEDMTGDIKILSIGRLESAKAFDRAIESAKILKERGLSFCWYVIGAGSLKDELIRQIERNGLIEEFVLLGLRKNPYPYIKNADIVVQTSNFEGKSMVLDEAKILGKPIVVTDYPTAKDQVKNEKEGLIVDMTAEAVAEGIIRIINDADLKHSIKNYLVKHEYGNQSEVEKYIKLFDS